jgi:1,4-dihydroxy-2-naphthoyl-CoA hydrolase
MSTKTFRHSFSVPLHDIDAAGILFFGHLFRHAHDAYEAFMAQLGFPLDELLREGRHLLPLVHAEADYRLPFRHGEAVTVALCVARIGRTSFTLGYRFLAADEQVRATAGTVHAHMEPGSSGASPLPAGLADALSGWLCKGT